MRKLVVLGIFASASLLCFGVGTVNAFQRFVPQFRPAPAYRPMPQFHPVPQFHPQYRPVPQVRINPGIRPGMHPGFVPHAPMQHFGNLGRHGLPMVHGLRGWHETHNRAAFAVIPGLTDTDPPIDLDDFVDGIDDTAPLLPVDACSDPCLTFGALSIANDGAWGSAWNAANVEAARAAALDNCLQRATEACFTVAVSGTAWIAGIQCDNGSVHWGGGLGGNDLRDSITNAYRYAFQQRGFDPNDCGIVAAVAGDGAQQQLSAGE